MNNRLWALALQPNGAPYAGGEFTTAGGVSASRIAKWLPFSWPITASAGAHGSIAPAGTVYVTEGGSTNFTITADNFYAIDEVVTNGIATAGASGLGLCTSVWANVAASGTVHATFAERVTANGTPHWWLDSYGLTNGGMSFEEASVSDTDVDGHDAGAENVANTDPTNSASFFVIGAIGQGGREISWASASGRVYDVLAATNLTVGGFEVLGNASNLPATPTLNCYTNTTLPDASPLYYRIRVRRE